MFEVIKATLTHDERAAVSIALQDAQLCGCKARANGAPRGFLGMVAALVFGQRGPTPLANPRLEAVRHFVCASRRRRRAADDLAAPLAVYGFSPAQIDALGLLSL